MWTKFVYALFGLSGIVVIGLTMAEFRSLPERGRPESMGHYIAHFFTYLPRFAVGSAFTGVAIAALFFDYSLGVAPWQQFAQVALFALGVVTVRFTWRRMRRRLRS